MTIEEKAKAYDKALEKAKRLYEKGTITESLCHIFPELEGSEDEKIRKELLSFCQNRADNYPNDPKYANISNWIAWLEKQGEQKTSVVDFKAKDWYVSKVDGKIYNAKFMEKTPTNQARKLEIEKAAMSATGIIKQEEWFIKGAEWSDKNPSYICSEKQNEQKPTDKVEPKTIMDGTPKTSQMN